MKENSISNINVKKSIELSQLSEFLENDDRKLDLRVGESGIKISGGQKQRIGVARALFHDPEILIFDEPTSSLDPITTNNLLDTLKKLNNLKTIILVSHDIKDFSVFDKVYEIKNKKMIVLKNKNIIMSKLKSNEKVIFCKKCVESNQRFVSSIPHKDKKFIQNKN